jgi:hypothetical protein
LGGADPQVLLFKKRSAGQEEISDIGCIVEELIHEYNELKLLERARDLSRVRRLPNDIRPRDPCHFDWRIIGGENTFPDNWLRDRPGVNGPIVHR